MDRASTDATRVFGAAAPAYARSRPGYPDEIVSWLLPAGTRDVLDLGAGAGALTGQLLARVLDVVAVEPSPGMRRELAARWPEAVVHEGRAESIPLPDASVDVVLCAQAWHWVIPEQAVNEVARVLRPGGRLGLVWNLRDETVPWVAELGRVMHRYDPPGRDVVQPWDGDPFTGPERRTCTWTQPLPHTGLRDLASSRSYVIQLDRAKREQVLDDVAALADSVADPDGMVHVPYRTEAFRYDLMSTE